METIKELLKPELIWFLIGLILLLGEFVIPGLIIFFFGVGAWVTALVCIFTDISINPQLIIFIVSSVLSLILLRKWLKGIFYGHIKSTQTLTQELDEFIGERARVVEPITAQRSGRIELHGTQWTAEADEDIATGATVEIIDKNSLSLKVKTIS